MKKSSKKIKKLILKFENGLNSAEKTLKKINKISSIKIDKVLLTNYWRSSDIENFVELLVSPEIKNWEEIDDTYADKLITEIKNNLINDALINKNITALEKRYKKSKRTIFNWIFHKNIMDNRKILELLKENTIVQL
ncbi:hypothetical protein A8C32_06925 [Flavivirga aquatica]|uniref:Uncharacterized protein n=1 Tax=Flavivirga aquatica TaxID=1849968 RepID=A0A1E5SIL7_9FLAO|nr:hypothetical protein [Flavivirga aquatica]OEJ98916.1 hypothetical protein A8C32_06925 [Flavivirga aquatica]